MVKPKHYRHIVATRAYIRLMARTNPDDVILSAGSEVQLCGRDVVDYVDAHPEREYYGCPDPAPDGNCPGHTR